MKVNILMTKCPLYLERHITTAIRTTLRCEGFAPRCEVSVTLTDNENIRELNKKFRGIDSSTDVLSFPTMDFEDTEKLIPGEPVELGDIVISLEQAKKQAAEIGNTFEREVAFLCVHSMLHLLGYDHVTSESDEKVMFERQKRIMDRFDMLMNA